MKKSLLILLFALLTNSTYAQDAIISLSTNDCNTCTVFLEDFLAHAHSISTRIVMPKKYERDSVFIIGKYSLEDYKNILFYSDSLFKKFNFTGNSEFNIVNHDSILYNAEWKKVDYDKISKIFQSNKQQCDIYIPSSFNLSAYNHPVIKNKFNNDYYIIQSPKRIDTIGMSLELEQAIYKVKYGQNWREKFDATLTNKPNVKSLKNIITGIDFINDSVTKAIVVCYYPLKIGDNTIMDKMFALIKFTNSKITKVNTIDFKNDTNFGIYEFNFHEFNNKLYICTINRKADSLKKYEVLAEYNLDTSTYKLTKILKFEIPKVNRETNVQYNNIRFFKDENFIIMPFSSTVINLEKNEEINLDFKKEYYDSLKQFIINMKGDIPFCIWDMKKIDTNQIRILYNLGHKYYTCIFNVITKKNSNIKDLFEIKDIEATPALTKKGEGVYYKLNEGECLLYMKL